MIKKSTPYLWSEKTDNFGIVITTDHTTADLIFMLNQGLIT